MTKAEFLSGKLFKDRHGMAYAYEASKQPSDICIGIISVYGDHHCNVEKVTDKFIYCYKSILGKSVNARIELSNLILNSGR